MPKRETYLNSLAPTIALWELTVRYVLSARYEKRAPNDLEYSAECKQRSYVLGFCFVSSDLLPPSTRQLDLPKWLPRARLVLET